MAGRSSGRADDRRVSRRRVIQGVVATGAAALTPALAAAQGTAQAPTVISSPPRDFGPGAPPPIYFTDPDVLTVDPAFDALVQPNAAVERLWRGGTWLEGPAWNSVGRFFVVSDIPNNRQCRWLEDDGRVTVFRSPANNSNGNTFDFQGRQLSCEHLTRRVVRYEHDGSITVIADRWDGRRFSSPNDVVAHPDGSYWFTDPPYGASLFEGQPDEAGGPTNPAGLLRPRIGQPPESGSMRRELPNALYRVDTRGTVTRVATEDQVPNPNGLAFSPDHRRLYVTSTGRGPGDTHGGGLGDLHVFDVTADNRLANHRLFADCLIDGVRCAPDGVRCDLHGNVWASSNTGRAIGYNGVTVWAPDGRLIGRIRLPEVCGNLCFGGPKRNRLFMAASQSIYALYVNTQGAGPA
ncbi:MAG: gluconolactonase [Acidobacteria bacterium SCN 69-37]|nr:MAG: gluconolactonase [Acidobacteria bacterium SCN 69-37]